MKKIKRAISFFMAFIIAVLYTVTGIPVLSEKTEPVQAAVPPGYHTGDLTKTYNIVRLDDQPDFSSYTKNYHAGTNSRFIYPFYAHCDTCNSQWGSYLHQVWQAACFYGYHDDIYNNWVLTGIHAYGGASNVLATICCDPTANHVSNSGNPIYGCGHKHDKYHNDENIPYTNSDVETLTSWVFSSADNWFGNEIVNLNSIKYIKDAGHSFSFSTEAGVGGTVTVTYTNQTIPNTYTITFDAQGGTSDGTSHTVIYDRGSWDAGAISSTRSGFKLQGWYTGKDGTGEKVYDSNGNAVDGTCWSGNGEEAVWKGLSDVTLYAYWLADTFTQTLNFYKGSTLFDTRNYDVKNGETFSAFDQRLDAGIPDNYHYSSVSEESWTVSGAKSASVYFTLNQMKVVYDGNGADGGSTSDAYVDYDTNLTVAGSGFSKTGYYFTGWNTASDGSGTSYSPGSTILMKPSSHGQEYRLYAQWGKQSYKQRIYCYIGSTLNKTLEIYREYGSTFNAENEAANAGITNYHLSSIDTSSWTVTGEGSTNAYFAINQMKVVYDGNGADGGSTSDAYVDYNTYLTVAGSGFSKTYFYFTGWNTASDGSGYSYSPGSTIPMHPSSHGQEYRLYAQWAKQSYTQKVYCYIGGSLNKTLSVSKEYGSTFDAEGTANNAGITNYYLSSIVSSSWTVTGEGSTYAYFAINQMKVVYDGNGNTGGSTSDSYVDYNTNLTVAGSGFSKTGYYFTGWNTSSDGSGTSYSAGSTIPMQPSYHGQEYKLYAQWAKQSYKQRIYCYTGGVFHKTIETVKEYDSTFDAEGTANNAGIANYHLSSIDTSSWTVTGEGSTNAYFAINQMKVVYDGNGNTGGSTTGTNVNYGQKLTVASNGFTKTYFHFTGWNTASDGSGYSYSPGSEIPMQPSYHGQEYRLYAQWERDTYTQSINYYRYEYNNGTWNWTHDKTVTYSAGAGLDFDAEGKARAETVSGYYYYSINNASWFVTGEGSTNAHFMPNTYSVSYNGNGATSGSMDDTTGCTYSVPFCLRSNGFFKIYYTFNGWNTKPDGSGTTYGNKASVKNLTTTNGGTAVLYAKWLDTTNPTLTLADAGTQNSWVHYTNVTLTAQDNGDGLAADSAYQYCLSRNTAAPESNAVWNTYTSGTSFSIGAGLTGTYYLYVKPVTDKAGNKSTDTYHKYGPYLFDNSAPADSIQSVYGWYESATEINFGIHDDYSGIKSIVIKNFYGIQLADITATGKYTFDTDGENFYSITLTDRLDNTVTKVFMVKLSKYKEVIPKNAVWKGLSDLRIYGHWMPCKYTVTFDVNGGTLTNNSATAIKVTYDAGDWNTGAISASRTGYELDGWYTEKSSPTEASKGEKVYDANGNAVKGSYWSNNGSSAVWQGINNVTLYAHWKPITYTVRLYPVKPSGASGSMTNLSPSGWTWDNNGYYYRTFTYDASEELPDISSVYSLTGWTDGNWNTAGNGSGTEYVSGTKVWNFTTTMNDTISLYATWRANTYTVKLWQNKPANALSSVSCKNLFDWTWNNSEKYYYKDFTYDTASTLPETSSVYTLTEYTDSGWYGEKECINLVGSGTKKWNLTSENNAIVNLYIKWVDSTGPRITVTPTKTTNSDAYNDAVRNVDITIRLEEFGSGLADDNAYEFGFSTSMTESPGVWNTYYTGKYDSTVEITLEHAGSDLTGKYYLWVKQISDKAGNKSSAVNTVANPEGFHVFGLFTFDNTAPAGNVTYIENNITLGLYNETITDSPYAVMTVNGAEDSVSGIKDMVLEIWDAADDNNRTVIAFTEEGGIYTCIFDLYNSLNNPQDTGKVRMRILATDNVGNTGSLPITDYDFGLMQNSRPIEADYIGYREVKSAPIENIPLSCNDHLPDYSTHIYERDAFRIEAYIENISFHFTLTSFMGGHFGRLRIYSFGYADSVSIDFASLLSFIKPEYDTDPNLPLADIPLITSQQLYFHQFKIPLYCMPSLFSDTTVYGYKKGYLQTRNVEYEVSDRIINHVKTILKYNVR